MGRAEGSGSLTSELFISSPHQTVCISMAARYSRIRYSMKLRPVQFVYRASWGRGSATTCGRIRCQERMALGLRATFYGLTSNELLFFNSDHHMYVYKT